MSHTALARKYRPKRFAEVAAQDHVSETLRRAIAGNRVGHAYLFCGPRGIGKTTLLLSDDVGVRVEVDTIKGINVVGLEKIDDVYVNSAYGESGVTLNLEVNVATGDLNLVVLDEVSEYVEGWDVEEAQ